jgi:hypothetical protein
MKKVEGLKPMPCDTFNDKSIQRLTARFENLKIHFQMHDKSSKINCFILKIAITSLQIWHCQNLLLKLHLDSTKIQILGLLNIIQTKYNRIGESIVIRPIVNRKSK